MTSPIANSKTHFTTPEGSDTDVEVETRRKYIINGESLIHFGAHKGKPHSDLLNAENRRFARWICEQEDFKCSDTRDWLLNKFVEMGFR